MARTNTYVPYAAAGLSLNTQQKFHCGYISSFTYKNNQTTPAVIIPTSQNSFMWRSTVENIKQKRGTACILNKSALTVPYCFVVEGEIDCMSVDECGFACIALGSTSNIRKIFEYDTSKTVLILALDNDQRGKEAEQGEVKSYVQDIAIAVMHCRAQAQSRSEFVKLMNAQGYGIVWEDSRKYITFIDLARHEQGEKTV